MTLHQPSDLTGLAVTVMGLGLNGGGAATVEFLTRIGARVTATDLRTADELRPTLSRLAPLADNPNAHLRFVLGEHRIEDFEQADFVIKNPAVRGDNPFLSKAPWVETDLTLFLRMVSNPILAVTGSKGKSTTVSALFHLFRQTLPHSFLGGNITQSPLTFIDEAMAHPEAPVILELSSWQLADIESVQCRDNLVLLRPKIAAITNILHDHQNAYRQFDDYVADKELIFKHQRPTDTFFALDNDYGRRFRRKNRATTFLLSPAPAETLPETADAFLRASDLAGFFEQNRTQVPLLPEQVSLLGIHSRLNLLFAGMMAFRFGIDSESVLRHLASFPGIPYRMQPVASHPFATCRGSCQLTWINDSAATMPDAMLASVCSFSLPTYLITGGTDKALDFAPYRRLPETVRAVFPLAGSATDRLLPCLPDSHRPVHPFHSLSDAVNGALQRIYADSPQQAVLLLSPGAASFGMFKNEFDRGDQFAALAASHAKTREPL